MTYIVDRASLNKQRLNQFSLPCMWGMGWFGGESKAESGI